MRLSCTVMEIWHFKCWTHRPGHRKKTEEWEEKEEGKRKGGEKKSGKKRKGMEGKGKGK